MLKISKVTIIYHKQDVKIVVITLKWEAQVEKCIKEGIMIKEKPDVKHPFENIITSKERGIVLDKHMFNQPIFNEGDIIHLSIKNIDDFKLIEKLKHSDCMWKTKDSIRWISVLHRLEGNGFFTKELKEGNRFAGIFTTQSRSQVFDDIYLNPDFNTKVDSFEVGDVLEIEISRR